MSDYRRLISYLYSYEGGVKGQNIGYVRLETRGGRCRICVSVKRVFMGAGDIGVYLLAPEQEIRIGRMFVRGGAGEFRTSVDAANVEGSGRPLDDCYGLTVHEAENAWQCCTTIWEDAVARTAEVTLQDVTAENVRKKEEAARVQREISRIAPEPADVKDSRERPGLGTGQGPESVPEDLQESGSGKEELPISAEIERALCREEERQKDIVPWDEKETPEPAAERKKASVKDPEQDVSGALKKDPVPAGPVGDETELARLEQEEREAEDALNGRERAWRELQGRCARLQAFTYDYGCEILSIKPQDIGLLPREIWIYGSNSFLLHGYYNHRHLILARLGPAKEHGQPRYLLGVPGHYFRNEKAMAAMFGFPRFVLSLHQPQKDARFGYWYTDIRL